MVNPEPWYGVRLLYQLTGGSEPAYEERILIVRSSDANAAIKQAEEYSKDYESDTTSYLGYAMAFNVFDENGECLKSGTEVFSLIRGSDLEPCEYLGKFYVTGSERTRTLD